MPWKSEITIDSDSEENISIDLLPLYMFLHIT